MQLVVVSISLVLAVAYAWWRIRLALKNSANPCAGCQGCVLKDAKKQKDCPEKEKRSKKIWKKEIK